MCERLKETDHGNYWNNAYYDIVNVLNKYGFNRIQNSVFLCEKGISDAHGIMSIYKRKALSTIGHLGGFSFHETRHYTCRDEDGLLLINGKRYIKLAGIIRE